MPGAQCVAGSVTEGLMENGTQLCSAALILPTDKLSGTDKPHQNPAPGEVFLLIFSHFLKKELRP